MLKKKKKKVPIYPKGHRKVNEEFLSRQTAWLCLLSKTGDPKGQAPDFLASPILLSTTMYKKGQVVFDNRVHL